MQRVHRRALAFFTGVGLSLTTGVASALVLHPDSTVLQTPPDAVIGSWNSDPSNSNPINGSAVAISSEYALLSAHQGGTLALGSQATFDGVTYNVVEFINSPNSEDFRIARLETLDGQPAQLTDFVPVYTGNQEVGQTLVLGGFGLGRGDDINRIPSRPNTAVIGYEWAGPKELRWGANVITATENKTEFDINGQTRINDTLIAEFDSPNNGVDGEATLANSDSGGGWFIFEDNQWFVAGLSQAVEDENISNPTDQALFSPTEMMWGVRLTSYSSFINSSILNLGDLNGDGVVTNGDISAFVLALTAPEDYAIQFPGLDPDIIGDFNGNGTLTNGDLAGFVDLLTTGGSLSANETAILSAVPEPATITLLGLTGLMALRRRRH